MSGSSLTTDVQALHGLRGFAFLTVLLAHFSNHYDLPLMGIGKVGVWVFFVLSAFLLSRQLLADGNPFSKRTLLMFWQRRALRIVPTYFAALLVYFLFGYLIDLRNVPGHLLFVDGNGHFWTVPVEVQFYAILPLVAAGVLWFERFGGTAAFLWLVAAWEISFLVFPSSWLDAGGVFLLPYVGVFLAGCCAAYIAHRNWRLSGQVANVMFVAIVVAFFLTIPSIWSVVIKPVKSDYFYLFYPLFSVLAAGTVLCCLVPGSWCSTVFGAPFFRRLGSVSFSGYLMHPLALQKTSYLAGTIGMMPAMALSAIAVVTFTCALYFMIEKPIVRRMQRYESLMAN